MVVAGLIVLVNHGAIVDERDALRAIAPATRGELIVANLGTSRGTRLAPVRLELGGLTAAQYRRVIDLYGVPAGTKPAAPDRP